MNQYQKDRIRILAVAPTHRGFGYVVMEGPDEILALGLKRSKGEDKNGQALVQVKLLVEKWQPQKMVLQNVGARDSRRAERIMELHAALGQFAYSSKLKVVKFSGTQLRNSLLNDPKGTKHDIAQEIAKRFPDALAEKVPPKRRAWDDENWRMGIFDAVALAVAFWKVRN